MGRYSTYTAWLASSGQSYLFAGLTSTVISTATIQALETRAEDLSHGYLAKRWSVPLTSTVGTVKTIVEDIVTYDIYRLLWPSDTQQDSMGNCLEDRYKIAMTRLTDLSEGKADLFDTAGNRVIEREVDNKFYFNNRNYTPTFGIDNELNWKVSNSRETTVSNERSNN